MAQGKSKKTLVLPIAVVVMTLLVPLVFIVVISSRPFAEPECAPAQVLGPSGGTDPLAGSSASVAPSSGQVDGDVVPVVAGNSDVRAQLLGVKLRGAPMTLEQATNAVAIAQVARELRVLRFGLEIALATAMQESGLRNLTYGDADSQGLFQQRPGAGWGTAAQITDPRLAAMAFFGRAEHTSNPGLLDVPGWQKMPLTEAAANVQRPRADLRGEYAKWTEPAEQIAALLGGDLPEAVQAADENCLEAGGSAPYTLATLNIRGNDPDRAGRPRWETRLSGALSTLRARGAGIAALQEVGPRQAKALATKYATTWSMYPRRTSQASGAGNTESRVLWDPALWQMTDARDVALPYGQGGVLVETPLVQLTSSTTGETIWVWSVRNRADNPTPRSGSATPVATTSKAGANQDLRLQALRTQLRVTTELKRTGAPVFLLGDFNDASDGEQAAHCVLTPALANPFGPGQSDPCSPPAADSSSDHIFASNVQFSSAKVDRSTETRRISSHPLVVATTLGAQTGCPPTGSPAEKGLSPDALMVLRSVNAQFGPHAYAGIGSRPNASDHPQGRAVDVMIDGWDTPTGVAEGDRIAQWVLAHAKELGLTYVIWRDRIRDAGDTAWRPYTHPNGPTANATLRHLDHVHVSVVGDTGTGACGASGEVVYPVPVALTGTDRRNWHESSSIRASWHTGTDFSIPQGTPVLAAHGGTVRITNGPNWYGRWLVKVETGPDSLTTWYAHMSTLNVTDGQQVISGQQLGGAGGDNPQDGNSTGAHLHFEVHINGGDDIYGDDNVNPTVWLATETKTGRT